MIGRLKGELLLHLQGPMLQLLLMGDSLKALDQDMVMLSQLT